MATVDINDWDEKNTGSVGDLSDGSSFTGLQKVQPVKISASGENFNVSDASFSQSKDVSSEDTAPTGVAWNDDGSKMYIAGDSDNYVYEYDLSTNYDISTASFSQSKDVSSEDVLPQSVTWNDDGSKMYVVGTDNDSVYEYDLSTSYDISTASFSQSFDVSSEDTIPTGMAWNDDGSKMYIAGEDNDSVYEYDVSTNYDISTASFSQSFDVSSEDNDVRGMAWNNDGSKMYVVGADNASVYEYDVSTNYDISTASFSQSFDVSSEDPLPISIAWNNDGSKMYIAGNDNDSVYEYDVSDSTGTGDVQFSSSTWDNISDASDIVVTEEDETTTRPYEIESLDTANNEAWIWVYGSWDSDDSDQMVVAAGTGDGTDYSQSGTGANPWSQTGINALLVNHDPSTVNDSVGADWTVTGTSQVDGQFGQAGETDGTDDKAENSDISIGGNNESTQIVWANPDSLGTNFERLVFAINGADDDPARTIQFNDNEQLVAETETDTTSGTNFQSVTLVSSVSTGTWYQLGHVYDGSDTVGYADGDNQGSFTADAEQIDDISLGAEPDDQRAYAGGLDEYRAYSESKADNWWQAEYDASPKGGQTFFSWSGPETTSQTFDRAVSSFTNTVNSAVTRTASFDRDLSSFSNTVNSTSDRSASYNRALQSFANTVNSAVSTTITASRNVASFTNTVFSTVSNKQTISRAVSSFSETVNSAVSADKRFRKFVSSFSGTVNSTADRTISVRKAVSSFSNTVFSRVSNKQTISRAVSSFSDTVNSAVTANKIIRKTVSSFTNTVNSTVSYTRKFNRTVSSWTDTVFSKADKIIPGFQWFIETVGSTRFNIDNEAK